MILHSDKYYKHQKIMDMFKVTQVSCPDMTVHVNSGTIICNNQIINFSERYSDVIMAPRIGTWLVVLSINKNGELVYTYGIQSTEEKTLPILPNGCFHLCAIEVGASDIYITNDMIFDLRLFFNYSENTDVTCACKCALEDTTTFTDDDRKTLKEFYDKYEALALEIDKLKLLHSPQKEHRVLSENGLEYIIKFHDDGTPYFTRVGIDEVFDAQNPKPKHEDYKFIVNSNKVNIINRSNNDYINVYVKIKSFDSVNENINCTLALRCSNSTIYSANIEPHYSENEFRITNLILTKSGLYEQFSIKFHDPGEHVLQMLLYKNDTQTLIDSAEIQYDVEFKEYEDL